MSALRGCAPHLHPAPWTQTRRFPAPLASPCWSPPQVGTEVLGLSPLGGTGSHLAPGWGLADRCPCRAGGLSWPGAQGR
uniref:Uncharacterized protein n=1 Tax=Chrysemys picta bellii TaxID=8478 RepID=A0A8C3H558_CHRPI